ncbi:MAG: UDP-N-acetylmuramoyl-tripeptide--D-alanyl-D-alanine ligase [Frankiales bacterium]|jgi:UDP-N-acetylmuramoyl-tripeptide--D-alanyl-D-alanine ligase|nr:UDP-N-acetylmuramoyl-tripeptide--D-alanyl-D-alanine ligase [Frankiales bacterium]
MTLGQVAAAVGGVVADGSGDAVVTSVTIDSRTAGPGSLFAALTGEHVDGHVYAASAGAAGVLAARPVGVPAVVVPDVTAALGLLAHAVLAALPDVTVVGITGSSGKTTTKDLLAGLLEPQGPTVAPIGSYNNEIGHPLTVLRADESTRFLVLEYSARGPGHIAYLCGIARPDVAVELNVGVAHLGEFGSREAIAAAKAELVLALLPDGVAVLNADDPKVAAMADLVGDARVVTYGTAGQVRAEGLRFEAGRARFTLVTPVGEAPVRLGLYGSHMASNALAAAAVAVELGVPVAEIADRLSAAVPRSRWRMEVAERADGVTVVNDSYNANPESVRAALETLVSLAGERRSWAVLGEMAELGAVSADAHVQIGALARQLGVSRLVAVGKAAAALHTGAVSVGADHQQSVVAPHLPAALALLHAELAPGDVVLVKGSRSAGLDKLAADLLADVTAEEAR